MTETDHWELNAFIAEYVMGWAKVSSVMEIERGNFFLRQDGQVFIHAELNRIQIFDPAWNSAQALMVLEKCVEVVKGGIKTKHHKDGSWTISKFEDLEPMWSKGETLLIAICKFSKQLFSTPDSPRPPAALPKRPPPPRD